jgi:hypothetical protein
VEYNEMLIETEKKSALCVKASPTLAKSGGVGGGVEEGERKRGKFVFLKITERREDLFLLHFHIFHPDSLHHATRNTKSKPLRHTNLRKISTIELIS